MTDSADRFNQLAELSMTDTADRSIVGSSDVVSLLPSSVKQTLLCTCRHAATDSNKRFRIYSGDEGLNEDGSLQAHEARERLRNVSFDVVISSPSLRARETALIVSRHEENALIVDEECAERHFGAMYGWLQSDLRNGFPDAGFVDVQGTEYPVRPPGGETLVDLNTRAARFLSAVLHKYPGKSVLIVSHGNFLQQLHAAIRGLDAMAALAQPLDEVANCALNQFVVQPPDMLVAHKTSQLSPMLERYPWY